LNKKATPYIILLGILFGTTLVVSRFSIGQFSPITYIGLRLSLVSLFFVMMYTLRVGKRGWPQGREIWGRGALMGVMGTAIPMLGIVASMQYLSSGLTSIMITVNPAITVLMAHFFLEDERLSRHKGVGIMLAVSGALLLVILGESGLPDVSQANPIGYALVLGGMVSGSIMTIYTRKYMQNFNAMDVTGIRMFAGALFVMPISMLFEGFDLSQVNIQGILGLLFAAVVGTFLGFLLSFYNIQQFGATAAVMTSYIIPVVTGLIGMLFLGEHITRGMMTAILLIILGVWMINARQTLKTVPIASS